LVTQSPGPPFVISVGALAPALARLGIAIAVIGALLLPSALSLWVVTPSTDDVQARVQAYARAKSVVLLSETGVPATLAHAVVATEDERFYYHHGIDSLGVARALLYDVTERCLCQGGSTITQQLVKDIYLGGSDRGRNKIEGMVLALKVERTLTKNQIMADYLSEITTGLGVYGVSAASCDYFNAPLGSLTLGQYALLAGVTQAPSLYDPRVNPQAAAARRAHVLDTMVADSYITPAQAAAANAEPVMSLRSDRPGC
jgi:membrane peptidoglycan carboxypeptidase